MQMNQRCGGRFHHQRVSCRSDFKETGCVFSNPTTLSLLCSKGYFETTIIFTIKRLFIFDAKLLPKARGIGPVQTVINT